MREIKYIVMHCAATPQNTTVTSILNYWKNILAWKSPGYHFLIEANGKINHLHPLDKPSNGVRGYNQNSIHISYIGGQHTDDRTTEQRFAMAGLVKALKAVYVDAEIKGHRDFPDVHKLCPNFEVKDWIKEI